MATNDPLQDCRKYQKRDKEVGSYGTRKNRRIWLQETPSRIPIVQNQRKEGKMEKRQRNGERKLKEQIEKARVKRRRLWPQATSTMC